MSFLDFFRKLRSGDHAGPIHELDGPEGAALDAIRGVQDPELDVSIVDLGLIRGLVIDGDRIRVEMTLTTPGCPLASLIAAQVEGALRRHGLEPEVEMTFAPPWSPDDVSPAGRAALARR